VLERLLCSSGRYFLTSPKEGDLKTIVSRNGFAHWMLVEGRVVGSSVSVFVHGVVSDRRESMQSGFPSSLATTEQQEKNRE